MKKTSFLSIIVLSLSLLLSPYAQASFSDVSDSHPYGEAIEYAEVQEIVGGYSDGNFKPNNKINRAEFAKIIIEATFTGQAKGENCFSDVRIEWYAKYICFAKDKGIIKGYPEGTFKPSQYISFAEAAKIIAIAFGFSVEPDELWYRPFVISLEEKRAIPTSIITFDHEITRAEMAEMIYRVKADIFSKTSQSFNSLVISDLTIKVDSIRSSVPCDCDKEKAAWNLATNNANTLQDISKLANDIALDKADESNRAEKVREVAQRKVENLNRYLDTGSSVTMNGITIYSGDLRLLQEANDTILDKWYAGGLSSQEAAEAWAEINATILEKLRAEKKKEKAIAEKELEIATNKANTAKSEAEAAKIKADAEQKKTDEAKAIADAAKKAYEDCLKKCIADYEKMIEETRKFEEARTEINDEIEKLIEENINSTTTTSTTNSTSGDSSTSAVNDTSGASSTSSTPNTTDTSTTSTSTTNTAPVEDLCKKPSDFYRTIAEYAQYALNNRESIPEAPVSLLYADNFITATQELIATAFKMATTSRYSVEELANALAALPQIASIYWPDYRESVRSTVNPSSSKICDYIKSRSDSCGSANLGGGDIAYWERDANGVIKVVELGPGDTVTVSQCE